MEKTMGRQVRSGDWVKTLVLTAVVAAMACAATLAVQIPSPTGGYLNLGDAVVLLGAYLLGRALCTLLRGRSSDHRLVLTCSAVFLIAAVCAAMDVSPLLGCMVLGATYANVRSFSSR